VAIIAFIVVTYFWFVLSFMQTVFHLLQPYTALLRYIQKTSSFIGVCLNF